MASIERAWGSVCLFTNGACGNINPLTESLRARLERGDDVYDRSGGSFEEARLMGQDLAREAMEAIVSAQVEDSPLLRCVSRTFRYPVRPFPRAREVAAEIAYLEGRLRSLVREGGTPDALYSTALSLAFRRRAADFLRRGFVPIEIQGMRIGDVVLLGIPGEVFVEIGLQVKSKAAASGFKCAVVELANDYLGYMPTDTAFEEGGYEPEMARSLGLGPGLEKFILEASGSVMEELF